ncbi:MAG: hypothetical protein HQL30_06500 [Candidatus Omnitrophica bacterium]|nr:hypothetical protein [Candidatus Omnitrophota bacterium]
MKSATESTLGVWTFTADPALNREMLAQLYLKNRMIWKAGVNKRYGRILRDNRADSIMLASGRYLIKNGIVKAAEQEDGDKLPLIRAVTLEDFHLLMQLFEKNNCLKYEELMKVTLSQKDLVEKYACISNHSNVADRIAKKYKRSGRTIFNDIIARAFVLKSLVENKVMRKSELSPADSVFLAEVEPALKPADFPEEFFNIKLRSEIVWKSQRDRSVRFSPTAVAPRAERIAHRARGRVEEGIVWVTGDSPQSDTFPHEKSGKTGKNTPRYLDLNKGAIENVAREIEVRRVSAGRTLVVGLDGDKHAFKSTFVKAVERELDKRLKVKVIKLDDHLIEGWYVDGEMIREEGWDWYRIAGDIAVSSDSGQYDIIFVEGFELFNIAKRSNIPMDGFGLKIHVVADVDTRTWGFMCDGVGDREAARKMAVEIIEKYPEGLTVDYDLVVDTSIKNWGEAKAEIYELAREEYGPGIPDMTLSILSGDGFLNLGKAEEHADPFVLAGTEELYFPIAGIHEYMPQTPLISECKLDVSDPEKGLALGNLFNSEMSGISGNNYYALFADRMFFALIRSNEAETDCDLIYIDGKDIAPGGPVDYWVARRKTPIKVYPMRPKRCVEEVMVEVHGGTLEGIKIMVHDWDEKAGRETTGNGPAVALILKGGEWEGYILNSRQHEVINKTWAELWDKGYAVPAGHFLYDDVREKLAERGIDGVVNIHSPPNDIFYDTLYRIARQNKVIFPWRDKFRLVTHPGTYRDERGTPGAYNLLIPASELVYLEKLKNVGLQGYEEWLNHEIGHFLDRRGKKRGYEMPERFIGEMFPTDLFVGSLNMVKRLSETMAGPGWSTARLRIYFLGAKLMAGIRRTLYSLWGVTSEEMDEKAKALAALEDAGEGYTLAGDTDLKISRRMRRILGTGILFIRDGIYDPTAENGLGVYFAERVFEETEKLLKAGFDKSRPLKVFVVGAGTGIDSMAAIYAAKGLGHDIHLTATDIDPEAARNTSHNINFFMDRLLGRNDRVETRSQKTLDPFAASGGKRYDLILFDAPNVTASSFDEIAHHGININSGEFKNILRGIEEHLEDKGTAVIGSQRFTGKHFPERLLTDFYTIPELYGSGEGAGPYDRVIFTARCRSTPPERRGTPAALLKYMHENPVFFGSPAKAAGMAGKRGGRDGIRTIHRELKFLREIRLVERNAEGYYLAGWLEGVDIKEFIKQNPLLDKAPPSSGAMPQDLKARIYAGMLMYWAGLPDEIREKCSFQPRWGSFPGSLGVDGVTMTPDVWHVIQPYSIPTKEDMDNGRESVEYVSKKSIIAIQTVYNMAKPKRKDILDQIVVRYPLDKSLAWVREALDICEENASDSYLKGDAIRISDAITLIASDVRVYCARENLPLFSYSPFVKNFSMVNYFVDITMPAFLMVEQYEWDLAGEIAAICGGVKIDAVDFYKKYFEAMTNAILYGDKQMTAHSGRDLRAVFEEVGERIFSGKDVAGPEQNERSAGGADKTSPEMKGYSFAGRLSDIEKRDIAEGKADINSIVDGKSEMHMGIKSGIFADMLLYWAGLPDDARKDSAFKPKWHRDPDMLGKEGVTITPEVYRQLVEPGLPGDNYPDNAKVEQEDLDKISLIVIQAVFDVAETTRMDFFSRVIERESVSSTSEWVRAAMGVMEANARDEEILNQSLWILEDIVHMKREAAAYLGANGFDMVSFSPFQKGFMLLETLIESSGHEGETMSYHSALNNIDAIYHIYRDSHCDTAVAADIILSEISDIVSSDSGHLGTKHGKKLKDIAEGTAAKLRAAWSVSSPEKSIVHDPHLRQGNGGQAWSMVNQSLYSQIELAFMKMYKAVSAKENGFVEALSALWNSEACRDLEKKNVTKLKLCVPIEVFRNTADSAAAFKKIDNLMKKGIEFELVLTCVGEKDMAVAEAIRDDEKTRKAIGMPEKLTVDIKTMKEMTEEADPRVKYDLVSPAGRMQLTKDMYAGRLVDNEYAVIVSDAVGKDEAGDLVKEFLKDGDAERNFSFRVAEKPEEGKDEMVSLAAILDSWVSSLANGNGATAQSIAPVPVALVGQIVTLMENAWKVLGAA